MIPGPVSKVLSVIRRITGKQDDTENLMTLNGVLEFLYRDENMMWLYFKVDGCRPLLTFREPCRNSCIGPSKIFNGIVIPAGIKNIRELRHDGGKIDITEARVDPACYYNRRSYQHPRAEHLPPRFLERDPDGSLIFFQSDCDEDCGLPVGAEYIDLTNNEQREDVVLGSAPSGTSLSVGQFTSLSFPERRGTITVTNVDGCVIGKYHPSILTPVHEWFRLDWGCPGQRISYRGLREPLGLVYPTDMVPFSDQPLWRLALKAYEMLDATELTSGQTNGLARIMAQLSSVGVADAAASKRNLNVVLQPDSSMSALGTGRRFSGMASPNYQRRRIW